MADASRAAPQKPDYNTLNVQQLEHRRDEEFARQEAALDEIHRGAKGLKQHAVAIDEHVEEDIQIINGIDKGADSAQVAIAHGERQAREVNAKRAQACRLYGVIAALVAAEVVMTIAGVRFV